MRQPGGPKHEYDRESTDRMNLDLGLKMECKARTHMWAETADMQTRM